MEAQFERRFDECPVCALKRWIIEVLRLKETPPEASEPFFETMANELKELGWARKEWTFNYDVKQGIVVDKQTVESLPKGAELSAYQFQSDICVHCGCVYAKRIARGKAKKQPKLILPDTPLDFPMGRG